MRETQTVAPFELREGDELRHPFTGKLFGVVIVVTEERPGYATVRYRNTQRVVIRTELPRTVKEITIGKRRSA